CRRRGRRGRDRPGDGRTGPCGHASDGREISVRAGGCAANKKTRRHPPPGRESLPGCQSDLLPDSVSSMVDSIFMPATSDVDSIFTNWSGRSLANQTLVSPVTSSPLNFPVNLYDCHLQSYSLPATFTFSFPSLSFSTLISAPGGTAPFVGSYGL